MAPTLGATVIYNTTSEERDEMRDTNHDNVQEQLPAVVVAVWGDTCVNLKVIQDGAAPDVWKTSVNLGDEQGEWNWPPEQ